MKKLRMTFLNAEGKKATLTQANCHQNLTADQVKSFMNDVAALDIIKKDGVSVYHQAESADYVETIVTELF